MTTDELDEILAKHEAWLQGEGDGERADLRNSDLRGSDLWNSDLRNSDLRGSDLRGSDLRSADLRKADLSGAKGILSPSDWMDEHLEQSEDGYIAYKQFGNYHDAPDHWSIEQGAVLEEVVNPCRTVDCACGVNVAVKGWDNFEEDKTIWRVLIRWEWLPGVVVPYHTDGKFRCERVQLLRLSSMDTEDIDRRLAEFVAEDVAHYFPERSGRQYEFGDHPYDCDVGNLREFNPTQSLDDMRIVEEELEARGLREDYIRELADMELADRNIAKFMEHMTDLITAPSSDRARAADRVIPDEEGEEDE